MISPIATIAAAIVAIGDIICLRYSDDVSDVTSNVFAFCVAASGTGKESIQQAAFEIHKVVGIQEPVYSTIKSEQEVIRNLTRHQPSYYQIDEVGIFLDKVKNAQKRGGAVYLESVLGILMSVYSKANGWMPLSGDVRESVSGMIKKEISQRENKLEEGANPTIEKELVELERSLEQLRSGLRQPFLSLLGFTTGITFSGLVTQETAANGFFGRALIFEEKDDVPPEKKKFRKRPMPLELELALQQLYMSGHYDKTATRIENYGSKVRISTTPEAEDMLENAMEIMHSLAEDHTEKSGMSSLFLRAK